MPVLPLTPLTPGSLTVQPASRGPLSAIASAATVLQTAKYPIYIPQGVFDGVTDDTAGILAAVASIPADSAGIVLIPGPTVVSSTITLPSTRTGIVMGVGIDSTVKVAAGANCDAFSVEGAYWRITNIGVDGNKDNNSSGNGITVKFPRTICDHLNIINCAGHGINNIGIVSQTAHANMYSHIHLISNAGDGFHNDVYSTDQIVDNLHIGSSGGYGIYTGSGTGQYTNCHTWGNTLDGFRSNAGLSNMITNCYSETNSQHGFVSIGTTGNKFSNCFAWENQLRGFYSSFGDRTQVIGCEAKNNKGGPGIAFDSSLYCQAVGNNLWDDFVSKLQTYGVQSAGTSDYAIVTNNITRAADHKTGSILLVGANNVSANNIV